MKNSEIYLMPKSTATLTQSGLLALLLQRQRDKVIELAELDQFQAGDDVTLRVIVGLAIRVEKP